jgi:hypothetical protein
VRLLLERYGKQPNLEFGKKYLSDTRNEEFYKALQFRVLEPGRVTPLKPSEMPQGGGSLPHVDMRSRVEAAIGAGT